jgi:hypothetical protein
MSPFVLIYRFSLPDGRERVFPLQLSGDSAELLPASTKDAPDWTKLEVNQCSGCPLSAAKVSHCPAALQMAGLIDAFSDVVSFDRVGVTVQTDERSVSSQLSAQQAVASFMGLVMAASGCPRTAVFRPMARFHLPFSSETETAYRVASMYLLAQYYAAAEGGDADVLLKRLEEVYAGIHAVNRGMAQRLRAATRQDAIVNAVVLLDVNTSLMPVAIHEILDEMKPAFEALLAATRKQETATA